MKWLIATTTAAALMALPMAASAQGNGKGNSAHAGERGNGHGNGNGNKGHKPAKTEARGDADRDMPRGGRGNRSQTFATPDTDIATLDDMERGRLVNCPPGLAKKNPPCVPPGLAAKGVTFSEWTGYDSDGLRALLDDRWTAFDPPVVVPDTSGLTQMQIQDIFDLPDAPDDQKYAVIDGRPVLLNAEDYDRLLTLNSLAERPGISGGVAQSPAAALTQEELVSLYGLPVLPTGQNYAVLDNQVITLPDPAYDLLQLIRILGAV